MNTRYLKVYESTKDRNVPCIMLQGKWVKEIGFRHGDQIEIQYEQGRISVNLITVETNLNKTR